LPKWVIFAIRRRVGTLLLCLDSPKVRAAIGKHYREVVRFDQAAEAPETLELHAQIHPRWPERFDAVFGDDRVRFFHFQF
jgi:hypothetical protein